METGFNTFMSVNVPIRKEWMPFLLNHHGNKKFAEMNYYEKQAVTMQIIITFYIHSRC